MTTPPTKPAQDTLFLLFAIFGSVINLLLGLLFGLATVSSVLSGTNASLPPPTWWAVAFGFLALCGAPAIYYGSRSVLDRSAPSEGSRGVSYLFAIPIFLSGLLLGYLSFSIGVLPDLFGPLAKITAASAASMFVVQMVRRFGPVLSPRRIWGQFILGLWVVPFFALISEFLVLIPTLLLFGLGALTSENGRLLLDLLADSTSPSIGSITEATNGILMEPWFIALVLGFFAVLVPLIEETLKTMIVWPWIYRRRSSAEAFLGGVIGGAGYALFEAIFLTQAEATWFPTMVGRGGATIMHAFTTGVASWGLSEGLKNKRLGRMIISFIVALGFHGLWNAGALSIALVEIRQVQSGELPTPLALLRFFVPVMIFALTLTAFLGLNLIAKRLHASPDDQAYLEAPQELVS